MLDAIFHPSRAATKGNLTGPRTRGKGDLGNPNATPNGDIAVARTELGMLKRMVGGIGVGMLLLIIRSFWPQV